MDATGQWFVEITINSIFGLVTVAALVVALVEARRARAEASAARRAMARERRVSFELQILADIYDQMGVTGTQHLRGHISALINDDSSSVDIPALRIVTGVKPPSDADSAFLTTFPRGSVKLDEQITRELDEAILRRLEER